MPNILISALKKNDISIKFEKYYDLKQLINIKYAVTLDSIDKIYEKFKFDFKKDNIKLIEGIHLLKIIIPIDLIKEKEMIFELPIKIKKDIEKFDILFKEVTNLKKEINTLKEENNKLKDENKNLKELFEKYIPCLEKCK